MQMALVIMALPVILILSLINIIGMWKMFEKAGIFGLWSLIPIVNVWLLFKIVYGTGIVSLTLLIPVINILVILHLNYSQVKVFGYDEFLMKIVSLFFPDLIRVYLGWSCAEYVGPLNSLNK